LRPENFPWQSVHAIGGREPTGPDPVKAHFPMVRHSEDGSQRRVLPVRGLGPNDVAKTGQHVPRLARCQTGERLVQAIDGQEIVPMRFDIVRSLLPSAPSGTILDTESFDRRRWLRCRNRTPTTRFLCGTPQPHSVLSGHGPTRVSTEIRTSPQLWPLMGFSQGGGGTFSPIRRHSGGTDAR